MNAPLLEIRALEKTYGEGATVTRALRDVSFEVYDGELVVVVGPSGCGKTTLLRCISGLIPPTSGEVRLRGQAVEDPPREMAVVFQDYSRSLMPWLSVRKNVCLPLRYKPIDSARREVLVQQAIESVGLAGFMDHYPWQLSGGMQQRVAIARALAYEPEILVMDEPFASVDAQTRGDLEDLVLAVRAKYGITMVFVTHDIDESVYMGDRIIVLSSPPTDVREVLEVNLPSPRHQLATKELPRFVELRARVFKAIRPPDVVEGRAQDLGVAATLREA